MDESNPVSTSGDVNFDSENSPEATDEPYRETIGSLLYLSNVSRPDITIIVNYLSKYMEKPKVCHWNASSEATKDVLWIRQLSMELGICEMLVPLYVDNKSALHTIKNANGKSLKRTKHIDIKYPFIREKVDKDIEIHHIDEKNQIA
ncbi:hypothetical protein JTB14_020530 [Gonioctena quinquepunctata]|nr:hypothetical protein JTB14_020530 [Gonioctena quinquepunctata]